MSYLYYTQTAGVVKIERPTLLVVTKCAKLRFRLNGENCVRSLAPPLPNATAAQPLAALPPYGCGVPLAGASLGCIWVPGGSAPTPPQGRPVAARKAFPTQGGRWPAGPDEGAVLQRFTAEQGLCLYRSPHFPRPKEEPLC